MKLKFWPVFLLMAMACNQKTGNSVAGAKQKNNIAERKNVTVYTTADSTRFRLSKTEMLTFSPF